MVNERSKINLEHLSAVKVLEKLGKSDQKDV